MAAQEKPNVVPVAVGCDYLQLEEPLTRRTQPGTVPAETRSISSTRSSTASAAARFSCTSASARSAACRTPSAPTDGFSRRILSAGLTDIKTHCCERTGESRFLYQVKRGGSDEYRKLQRQTHVRAGHPHPNRRLSAALAGLGRRPPDRRLVAGRRCRDPVRDRFRYLVPRLRAADAQLANRERPADHPDRFSRRAVLRRAAFPFHRRRFFALLFALLFHPLVPLRNTLLGNLLKALAYGTVLAIISASWWVPAVYIPHHAGFLSTSLGWKLTFGIFLWHWIYGYFLGTVYCPLPKTPIGPSEEPAELPSRDHDPAGRRIRVTQAQVGPAGKHPSGRPGTAPARLQICS